MMRVLTLLNSLLLLLASAEVWAQPAAACPDFRCQAVVAADLVYMRATDENAAARRPFDRSVGEFRRASWTELLPQSLPENYRSYLVRLAEAQSFYAALFYFPQNNVSVLAFRGSGDIWDRSSFINDWLRNNAVQLVGVVPFQYGLAQQLRWYLEETRLSELTPLVLAGHSLGGGLATYAALGDKGKIDEVFTFNPARTNWVVNAAAHGAPAGLPFTNVRVETDPVSPLGIGRTIGTDEFVPYIPECGVSSSANANNDNPLAAIDAHFMGAVLRGMSVGVITGKASAGSTWWTRTKGFAQCLLEIVLKTLASLGLVFVLVAVSPLIWFLAKERLKELSCSAWFMVLAVVFILAPILFFASFASSLWMLIPIFLFWMACKQFGQGSWLKGSVTVALTLLVFIVLTIPQTVRSCSGGGAEGTPASQRCA